MGYLVCMSYHCICWVHSQNLCEELVSFCEVILAKVQKGSGMHTTEKAVSTGEPRVSFTMYHGHIRHVYQSGSCALQWTMEAVASFNAD